MSTIAKKEFSYQDFTVIAGIIRRRKAFGTPLTPKEVEQAHKAMSYVVENQRFFAIKGAVIGGVVIGGVTMVALQLLQGLDPTLAASATVVGGLAGTFAGLFVSNDMAQSINTEKYLLPVPIRQEKREESSGRNSPPLLMGEEQFSEDGDLLSDLDPILE